MAFSQEPGFVDRIYPLDGGLAFAPNKAMYSPGHFEGETVALSCNAFLIQRGDEWLLWDTGISQKLFDELGGRSSRTGFVAWWRVPWHTNSLRSGWRPATCPR